MRDPHVLARDKTDSQETEFGFGAGQHPDPRIDYSDNGAIPGFPIADPDRNAQIMELRAIRRMDLQDPNAQPDPYVAGNTERYGAQPPLVRETRRPRAPKQQVPKPARMQRAE
jgi:hypothetical protein